MTSMSRAGCLAVLLAALAGCVAPPSVVEGPALSPPQSDHTAAWQGDSARWQHYPLPGKSPTEFKRARIDGRDVFAVTATSSASMLRTALRIEPQELGSVRFSWKVPQLIAQADMALREADDSPVRVILAFEGDRSRFSARNAALSELTHALTGEPMPYATLMYVWCNKRKPGTVITNPRTDRIRKVVVESGAGHLNRWLEYERDIRADYERAFGEAPGALVGIAIMTDTDNTRSTAKAWYGPVRLARHQSP